jgi:hypothetical protein
MPDIYTTGGQKGTDSYLAEAGGPRGTGFIFCLLRHKKQNGKFKSFPLNKYINEVMFWVSES